MAAVQPRELSMTIDTVESLRWAANRWRGAKLLSLTFSDHDLWFEEMESLSSLCNLSHLHVTFSIDGIKASLSNRASDAAVPVYIFGVAECFPQGIPLSVTLEQPLPPIIKGPSEEGRWSKLGYLKGLGNL
jgi:hypothetical protein